MNPTPIQVTHYQCGLCKHEHADEARAKACCLCDKCGKNEGIKVTFAYDRFCRACMRAEKLRKTREDLKLAEKHLADFVHSSNARIEYFKKGVERARKEYEVARAKTDEKKEAEVST